MTNKVKPFYIKITDDMTPQIVQDAFDKCNKLGAKSSSNDEIENFRDWGYFGVCGRDGTYFSDSWRGFYDAQEITLDQLDEWLRTEEEVEWKNGDKCEHGHHHYSGANKMTYIGAHPFVSGKHICLSELKGIVIVDSIWLRKPETQQQREDRERLENGKSLHTAASKTEEAIAHGFFRLWEMEDKETRNHYCQLAEIIGHKANYRK